MAAWGLDGHNSHTNICSSGARAGYHYWMGFDRPSPDHANADVILLVSAHLESGHYFNPHAQRIMEAKREGAKLIVLDVRLSNTATHADHWLAPYPGSEASIFLAIARHLIEKKLYDREFVRRWWNWQEYLEAERPDLPATFESFEDGARRSLPRVHLRATRRKNRASRLPFSKKSRGSWRRPAPASRPTTGEAPRPGTSEAGRSRELYSS